MLSACSSKWQKTPFVDFAHVNLPTTPNYCYVCPSCEGKHQMKAPVFALPAQQLEVKWDEMIKLQPRTSLLKQSSQQKQYVQRSAFFRFPDIIDVKFISLDNDKSTLMVLSRSVYGHSDFGVNCKRAKSWIQQLT